MFLLPRFSFLFAALALSAFPIAAAEARLDFTTDPAWEGFENRNLPNALPVTRQDFAWRETNAPGAQSPGEIGGWIQRSITPASFAKAIPTKSLDDRLHASGKFRVTQDKGGSGVLLGWFNQDSKGWRTPNSLVFRLDGNGGKYWVFFEYGTKGWLTGCTGCFEGERYQTTPTKPFRADGTLHAWELAYDPAGAAGNGEITFTLDGQRYTHALAPGHKRDGAQFNRFGILNQQLTGDGMEAYFSDLVLDGKSLDLTKDPGWLSAGNHAEFEDRRRRPFQDFGWIGSNPKNGAIGGLIWRDVKPAYYAAKTERKLTLNDELVASGSITFHSAGSDSGVYFGWFDSNAKKDPSVKEQDPSKNILAILIEGPSRIGHYFRPEFRGPDGEGVSAEQGPLIRPDGQTHRWEMRYSPEGSGGNGEIIVKLDDHVQKLSLKPAHRKTGATFDRFGIFNSQTGGHYVEIVLDDLVYTH